MCSECVNPNKLTHLYKYIHFHCLRAAMNTTCAILTYIKTIIMNRSFKYFKIFRFKWQVYCNPLCDDA